MARHQPHQCPSPEAIVRAALERAASIAQNACLVPPDGGNPTPEEEAVCRAAADYIEALASDPAAVAAIIKKAGEQ
jgi:hypothetical protein